jgi:hypothetical protein
MRLQALLVAGLVGVAGVAAERPFDSAKYRASLTNDRNRAAGLTNSINL